MAFYAFDFDTPLPPPVVADRLRTIVHPAQGDEPSGKKPFTGTVGDGTFRIARVIRHKNSFLPIVRGTWAMNSVSGTRVRVRMTIHPFPAAFMLLWFGGLAWAIAAVWSGSAQGDDRVIPLMAGMFVFGVILMVLGFVPEAAKAKRLIENALHAK
jgi:hypothetical protein